MAHGGLAILSLILRIVNFILLSVHNFAIPPMSYVFLVFEVIIVVFFLVTVKIRVVEN